MEQGAEKVWPNRGGDTWKGYPEMCAGDKIVEQHCSLSLSRSAVGWALECAGRVRWVFMSRLCPFCPSWCQGCAAPLCLL